MTGWYQPFYQPPPPQPQPMNPYDTGLRTPDGEPIYLGPFTAAQAPHLICSNCGQPITVGQEVMPDLSKKILGITPSGRLVYVSTPSNEDVVPCHADDCCTEYSHDHISEDTCGNSDEAIPCGVCGVPTDNDDGLCGKHGDQLSGDSE